jgi:5-formyltetrahydrofolate cyclo-ligase
MPIVSCWLIPLGSALFTCIRHFKPYQDAKRIGIYLSMPTGEIQTDAIVRDALNSGKQVFVPYLHKPQSPDPTTPKSVMDMVDLRSLSDYDSLERDNWGIPTISADTVHEREHILTKGTRPLDMILMPGVAFEFDPRHGTVKRLGHGKGFYDYFLYRYPEIHSSVSSTIVGTNVLLYGLALEEQYLTAEMDLSVPVGEYDSPLHGLLLGDGTIVDRPSTDR